MTRAVAARRRTAPPAACCCTAPPARAPPVPTRLLAARLLLVVAPTTPTPLPLRRRRGAPCAWPCAAGTSAHALGYTPLPAASETVAVITLHPPAPAPRCPGAPAPPLAAARACCARCAAAQPRPRSRPSRPAVPGRGPCMWGVGMSHGCLAADAPDKGGKLRDAATPCHLCAPPALLRGSRRAGGCPWGRGASRRARAPALPGRRPTRAPRGAARPPPPAW